jgi:hypothetical protein
MEPAEHEAAAYIARWRPSPVSPQAAAFARDAVARTGPGGRERAKNLLWAAGKLAGYGIGLGPDSPRWPAPPPRTRSRSTTRRPLRPPDRTHFGHGGRLPRGYRAGRHLTDLHDLRRPDDTPRWSVLVPVAPGMFVESGGELTEGRVTWDQTHARDRSRPATLLRR